MLQRNKLLAVVWGTFLILLIGCSSNNTYSTDSPENTSVPPATIFPSRSLLPTPVLESSPTWTLFTNTDKIRDIAVDHEGNLWTVGDGGAVRWERDAGAYTHFTIDNGLPDMRVTTVTASPDGTVWLGTWCKGVASYNGNVWTIYTEDEGLVDNCVRAISVARDGDVWIGTSRWLSHFDGQTWTTYDGENGLKFNDIREVAATSDGGVWVGGILNVAYFDGESWAIYGNTQRSIYMRTDKIAVASDGSAWFLGAHSGVLHFIDDQWYAYGVEEGLPDQAMTSIDIAPDGTVWVEWRDGIAYFDGQVWIPFEAERALCQRLTSPAVTPDDTVWVSTSECDVAYMKDTSWQTLEIKDGLPSSLVRGIVVAPNSDVWVDHVYSISRFDGKNWSVWRQPRPNWLYLVRAATLKTGGILWDASDNSEVTRYAEFGDAYRKMAHVRESVGGFTDAFAIDQGGGIWRSTERGVAHFDGQTWTPYGVEYGIIGGIRSLAIAPDGTVWAGSDRICSEHGPCYGYCGILRFDKRRWHIVDDEEGLSYGCIRHIAVTPDERVWFVTEENIVSYFDAKTGANLTEVGHILVTSIAIAPDSSLWFGTWSNGIVHFENGIYTQYTTEDGLISDWIKCVAVADDGTVWIGTNIGISRLSFD